MTFVLDSSVAVAWVLPDEDSVDVDAIAARLESEPAIVPVIWPLEVHNALLVAQRRARIAHKQLDAALRALSDLAIEVDHDVSMASTGRALSLAAELGLSVYDASYLELAARQNIPLASIDRRLRVACKTANITVL